MLPSTLSHMTFTSAVVLSEVTGPACMLAICRGADSMEEVRGRGSWPRAGHSHQPRSDPGHVTSLGPAS